MRPGDDVPRLGHIAASKSATAAGRCVDDKGGDLIVSAAVEPTTDDGGHFSKTMIFGDGK